MEGEEAVVPSVKSKTFHPRIPNNKNGQRMRGAINQPDHLARPENNFHSNKFQSNNVHHKFPGKHLNQRNFDKNFNQRRPQNYIDPNMSADNDNTEKNGKANMSRNNVNTNMAQNNGNMNTVEINENANCTNENTNMAEIIDNADCANDSEGGASCRQGQKGHKNWKRSNNHGHNMRNNVQHSFENGEKVGKRKNKFSANGASHGYSNPVHESNAIDLTHVAHKKQKYSWHREETMDSSAAFIQQDNMYPSLQQSHISSSSCAGSNDRLLSVHSMRNSCSLYVKQLDAAFEFRERYAYIWEEELSRREEVVLERERIVASLEAQALADRAEAAKLKEEAMNLKEQMLAAKHTFDNAMSYVSQRVDSEVCNEVLPPSIIEEIPSKKTDQVMLEKRLPYPDLDSLKEGQCTYQVQDNGGKTLEVEEFPNQSYKEIVMSSSKTSVHPAELSSLALSGSSDSKLAEAPETDKHIILSNNSPSHTDRGFDGGSSCQNSELSQLTNTNLAMETNCNLINKDHQSFLQIGNNESNDKMPMAKIQSSLNEEKTVDNTKAQDCAAELDHLQMSFHANLCNKQIGSAIQVKTEAPDYDNIDSLDGTISVDVEVANITKERNHYTGQTDNSNARRDVYCETSLQLDNISLCKEGLNIISNESIDTTILKPGKNHTDEGKPTLINAKVKLEIDDLVMNSTNKSSFNLNAPCSADMHIPDDLKLENGDDAVILDTKPYNIKSSYGKSFDECKEDIVDHLPLLARQKLCMANHLDDSIQCHYLNMEYNYVNSQNENSSNLKSKMNVEVESKPPETSYGYDNFETLQKLKDTTFYINRKKRTKVFSVSAALEEDAPGLLEILREKGYCIDDLRLYDDALNDQLAEIAVTEESFQDLETVVGKVWGQVPTSFKMGRMRKNGNNMPTYCLPCLLSLIDQTLSLQQRNWPVQWGWCRQLQAFIFVFERHNRIVLERPEYGFATYFFELVESLPVNWQVKRLITVMSIANCSRAALLENRPLMIGEDLSFEEGKILEEYGWVPNSGFASLLNYCDRVVHDRKAEDETEWRSKIGKVLIDGYKLGSISVAKVPKKLEHIVSIKLEGN